MTTYIFLIRTLTNLHAGSGDSGGAGVADKLVQRDSATNLPTIHASGIKGALREYFRNKSWVNDVFGSNPKDRDADKIKPGSHRFFSADLLAMPEPQDAAPHFRLVGSHTSSSAIQSKFELLGATGLNLAAKSGIDIGERFKKEVAEELPVLARNYLDNGISKNLWYEEFMPRESVFATCIQAESEVLTKELNEKVIQLGGNATVGCGFCLFTQLSPELKP
jgi:CRISPR-associated protein Cmr4